MRTPPSCRSACGTRQVLFLFAFQYYSVIMNEEHFFSKHDRRSGSTFDTGICRKRTVGGNGRWAGGAIVKQCFKKPFTPPPNCQLGTDRCEGLLFFYKKKVPLFHFLTDYHIENENSEIR